MAEYFHGSIKIGGNISKQQQAEIVEILGFECPDLGIDNVEKLKDLVDEDNHVLIQDDNLPYGRFDNLEFYLEKNKIPFKSYSSAYFDFAETTKVYYPAHSDKAREINYLDKQEVVFVGDLMNVWNTLKSISLNKTYEDVPEVFKMLTKEMFPNTYIPPVLLSNF